MFSARKKIAKEKGAEPDEFEDSVAQVCTATCSCASTDQSSTKGALQGEGSGVQHLPMLTRPYQRGCWQAIFDLEATNQELKSDLRDLYITSAKEVEVATARKAIVIHVRP